MIQIREGGDLTGHDAVSIREECVGPLLEQAMHRGEYVWGWRREVEWPVVFAVVYVLMMFRVILLMRVSLYRNLVMRLHMLYA